MMPIWIFTLGTTIFDRGDLSVPYKRIGYMAIGLIVPLTIGLLIQRYLPRLAKLLVRILKTCSSLLIIFIVIFAIVTNLYLFELFTWQVRTYVMSIDTPSYQFLIDLTFVYTRHDFLKIDFRCWARFAVDCLHCRLGCGNMLQAKT